MIEPLAWSFLLGALVLLGIAVVTRALRFRRDYFFLLIYAQSLLYLHIGPTLCLPEVSAASAQRYLELQAATLCLFEVPFLLLYVLAVHRIREERPAAEFSSRHRFQSVFSLLVLALAAVFLWVADQQSLLFRRVGEALAERQVEMPFLSFAVYRWTLAAGPFVFAVLFLLSGMPQAPWRRAFSRGVAALYGLIYIGYTLPNSRLETVRTLAFAYGVYLLFMDHSSSQRRAFGSAARMVGLTMLALYAFRVAGNARGEYTPTDPIPLRVFNPFFRTGEALDTTIAWRLNGIDLMAELTPEAEARGYAWGKAWAVPLFLSVGQIIDPNRTADLKLSLNTTAKKYLMERYTDIRSSDYFSCIVTDAYGNFAALGFLLVALVLAGITSAVTWVCFRGRSSLAVLSALLFAFYALKFEQEFIALLSFWVKELVPTVVLLWLLNPFASRLSTRPRTMASD